MTIIGNVGLYYVYHKSMIIMTLHVYSLGNLKIKLSGLYIGVRSMVVKRGGKDGKKITIPNTFNRIDKVF